MSQSYYHVGYTLPPGVNYKEIEAAIGQKCQDWMRYAPNSYIVWTDADTATLGGAILAVNGMNHAYFLIVKIDINTGFGWLPPWAWEWLRRERQQQFDYTSLFPNLLKPPQ